MSFKILVAENMDVKMLEKMQAKTTQTKFDYKPDLTPQELEKEIVEYDGLIVRPKHVSAKAIENGKKLRLIIRGGAGVNSIALGTAKKQGAVVENTPGLNTQATAEFTFLSMMQLFCKRQILRSNENALGGDAGAPENYMGQELRGKKLGIIGLGNVGSTVAKMAAGFGMEIFCYARNHKDLPFKQTDDLHELLSAKNDIISLHIPLSEETAGIIGEKEFSLLKNNTILVNTARPQLVDVATFAAALDDGKLESYAIDGDQDQIQPFIEADEKIRGMCTHHIADCTYEAHADITEQTMRQAIDFFENGEEINRVV